MVTYTSIASGNADIAVQIYDSSGLAVGAPFAANSTTTGKQQDTAIGAFGLPPPGDCGLGR